MLKISDKFLKYKLNWFCDNTVSVFLHFVGTLKRKFFYLEYRNLNNIWKKSKILQLIVKITLLHNYTKIHKNIKRFNHFFLIKFRPEKPLTAGPFCRRPLSPRGNFPVWRAKPCDHRSVTRRPSSGGLGSTSVWGYSPLCGGKSSRGCDQRRLAVEKQYYNFLVFALNLY